MFDESTRCVTFGGKLLVVGFVAGRIPEIAVNIPLIKGFSVVGVRAGEYARRFPDRGKRIAETLDALANERRSLFVRKALAVWKSHNHVLPGPGPRRNLEFRITAAPQPEHSTANSRQ